MPFRKGLAETGVIEGQNVLVEYHWLDGQYDQLSALMADLIRRRLVLLALAAQIELDRHVTERQMVAEYVNQVTLIRVVE